MNSYNWGWFLRNSLLGLFYSIVFIFANLLTSFSIALPIISLSMESTIRAVVVVGLAPIIEELVFLLVLCLLFIVFKRRVLPAFLVTGGLFGLYHLLAYQAEVGAMISALIFRLIICIIYYVRKSRLDNPFDFNTTSTLISVIILHAAFNAWILNKSFGFVVVG